MARYQVEYNSNRGSVKITVDRNLSDKERTEVVTAIERAVGNQPCVQGYFVENPGMVTRNIPDFYQTRAGYAEFKASLEVSMNALGFNRKGAK